MSTTFDCSLPVVQTGSVVCELEPPVVRESLPPDGEPDLDEFAHAGVDTLLSMADLAFLDTPRIGWLLAAHRRFDEAGARLVLHSVGQRAQESLEFLRLDRVLHIAKDEAAALESLRPSPRRAG